MEQFLTDNSWLIVIIALWTLPWKGVALWKSAQQNEKWWFVALLIIQTVAILEILYIFVFSRKKELKDQRAE